MAVGVHAEHSSVACDVGLLRGHHVLLVSVPPTCPHTLASDLALLLMPSCLPSASRNFVCWKGTWKVLGPFQSDKEPTGATCTGSWHWISVNRSVGRRQVQK